MLHSILQMPPEFWTSGATDIAQRHSRYLEASKRISQLEYERCEASRERDDAIEELARVRRELVAANRGAETNAKVNQGLCTRLAEAERERDEARRERDELLQRLSVWESAGVKSVISALMAYEMSAKARWTLQEIEQKEEAK
jgi:hypothetical protein